MDCGSHDPGCGLPGAVFGGHSGAGTVTPQLGCQRVRQGALAALPSADTEIELELSLGAVEPARLRLGIRPGGEHPIGRGVVGALDDECGVLYGSVPHRVPSFGGSELLSARYLPRRS